MIFDFLSKDIGVDLGTANTLVYVYGKGIVLREPSVVAMRTGTRDVLAVGENARAMLGRTPGGITAVRPLRGGVIADFEITEAMLKYFIKKALESGSLFSRYFRAVICVPGSVTEVEKRAVEEAARNAGAREAILLDEPMAAALGAGLNVKEPSGCMVVDVGGGTTEVAVISLGGIVCCRSLRVGGNHIDEAIAAHVRKEYSMLIGDCTAEEIKISIGSATRPVEKQMEVRGRDIFTGLPRSLTLGAEEVNKAIEEPIAQIVNVVRQTLEQIPPELAGDIMENGIKMTGGGALLRGLPFRIQNATNIKTEVAQDPMDCVALGAGIALDELKLTHHASIPLQPRMQLG